MMPTDAELTFWFVALILAVITVFVILPLINRYLENKDIERVFSHRKFEDYHDDMEDYKKD